MKHLILYDTECGFCQNWALRIARLDKKEEFAFAAINGNFAKKYFASPPNSIVLIEDFQNQKILYVKSKAIFRIFLLLEKKSIGIFYFLPSFLFDWGYWLVAVNRSQKPITGNFPPRFLS